MKVPDPIRKCVVFLGCEDIYGKFHVKGTGFFIGRPLVEKLDVGDFVYLVTAGHVITGIRDLGLKEVLVRMNYKTGDAKVSRSDITHWRFHPTDKGVDVAVLPIHELDPFALDQMCIPWKMMSTAKIVTDGKFGLGEEVFMSGLFSEHYGKNRNTPIVRIGNMAAMPEEQVTTRVGACDAYLIEARSIGGLSGSPVFINLEPTRFQSANRYHFYLLGLMHGHWEDDETGVNMGVGIVVPAEKITEVIRQEDFDQMEKNIAEGRSGGNLPNTDSVPST